MKFIIFFKIFQALAVFGVIGFCLWWKIMVNRIQYDGSASLAPLQSPSQASAELGPSPVPADAEIPALAVPGASQMTALPQTQGHAVSKTDYTLAKIKMYNTSLADLQSRQQEVQKLREKLISGYKRLLDQGSVMHSSDASKSSGDVPSTIKQPSIAQPHIRLLGAALSSDASVSGENVSPTTQLDAHQQDVLDRIQRAIERVDKIQSQLQGDSGKTSEMLALTTSLDSLTNVQTAVGGADYSSKSASILVDEIMQNVAAAVASHGNLTSQAVQLALM